MRRAMFFRLTDTERRVPLRSCTMADDNFLHVAVGSMQQPALFRRRQHRDRARRAGGAEVGAFERIDGDVDVGNVASVL